MVIVPGVVAKKTDTRCCAVADPQIETAIKIPVNDRHGPRVIHEIQLGQGRDVGKLATANIEKTTVAFVPAKATPLGDHVADGLPPALVAIHLVGGCIGRFGRLRHDLSPEEASQIVCVLGGDESVRDVDVFPRIIVQIDELGSPSPASHRDITRLTDILKTVLPKIAK